jgi:hypothetical protein
MPQMGIGSFYMGKKSSEKKRRCEYKSSTEKGRVVEKIIASMHEAPGVKVERNAFLPVLHGRRRREIDVLITSEIAGYPVRIAFECKNEAGAIGAPAIDGFIGKLEDIGIPSQQGIFVSASGFTKGAIDRAQKAGVRPLVLKGLTNEDILNSVGEAFQSVIYLLPVVTGVSITNNVPNIADTQQIALFFDREGNPCGSLPDTIWQMWVNGTPPSMIGEHLLELKIPKDWYQIINGKREQIIHATAGVKVLGLVVTIPGKVERHLLINAESASEAEKFQIKASFDLSGASYPVTTILTEAQLNEFLDSQKGIKVSIGRVRLPRIRLGPIYWPPSERSLKTLWQLTEGFRTGKAPDPRPIDIRSVEGTDLSAIWDPIWTEYLQNQKE